MADKDENASFLRVPTGLKLTPTLTLDNILGRARERLALIALGREELAFLTAADFAGRCRPDVTGDFLDLLVPVVFPQPTTMAPSAGRGRQRDLLGMLESDDEARTAAVKQMVERLRRNAELVELTGQVMNTAADVKATLERIEHEEEVDLEPGRWFHRGSTDVMVTEIEGHEVAFRRQPVRNAVASELRTPCRLILGGAHKTFTDYRAVLEGEAGDLFGADFKGRLVDVRIGMLRRWQRIVLDGARQLSLSIDASAKPVFSTATLRQRHLEVHDIKNWDKLLDETIAALQKARAALGGGESS